MEMKIHLEWQEIAIYTLILAYLLFIIVTTINDKNVLGQEKNRLDKNLADIKSASDEISNENIRTFISHRLDDINHEINEIYNRYKIAEILFVISFIILYIIIPIMWVNRRIKYEQKITQLEWALREEKEKSKEKAEL